MKIISLAAYKTIERLSDILGFAAIVMVMLFHLGVVKTPNAQASDYARLSQDWRIALPAELPPVGR